MENKSEALKKIASFVEARNKSDEQKRTSIMNEIKKNEEIVMGFREKILELKEIVGELGKNNIPNGILFMDEADHRLGFKGEFIHWDFNDLYGVKSIKLPLNYFGIIGGGYCGNDLLLNLDTGKIEFQGEEDDYQNKLKRFVSEFGDYEKNVYEIVEKL